VSLAELARDDDATIDAISSFLDGLAPADRVVEARSLNRDEQRRLYAKAVAARPLGLEDFVPSAIGPHSQVIHHGRNTLHLPDRLQLFEKRFCRPDGATDRLFGYNASPFERSIGPGFFVALPTSGHSEWEGRGAVVVDYFRIPEGPTVEGWPAVVPNTKGLQRFVYHRTRDFMRRVSVHVTIGAAFRGEKPLDHYFVLCREVESSVHTASLGSAPS
jgi:hypothetical protein